MIKHVVLFKFKPFENEALKAKKINQIRLGLLNLKNIIPEVQSIEVEPNMNVNEKFDLALISTHNSWEDLSVYDKHPSHMIVKGIIKEVLDTRSAVDFEF